MNEVTEDVNWLLSKKSLQLLKMSFTYWRFVKFHRFKCFRAIINTLSRPSELPFRKIRFVNLLFVCHEYRVSDGGEIGGGVGKGGFG